ncbi:MAG: DUF3786 domain-containing protein [Desulfitobacteriaceae bacterium]
MNYTSAHTKALEMFQAQSPEEMARYSGYQLRDNRFQVNFLGQEFEVEYPTGKFSPEPSPEGELPIFAQILILHYLANTKPVTEEGKLISYKELPGGSIYIQPFTNRAIRPLVKQFGDDPASLIEVASKIGGEPVRHGDAAVLVRAFPRVPVTMVVWGGDDEFPASGNILFDASAGSVLHTEDFAVLASFVVATMKRRAQK